MLTLLTSIRSAERIERHGAVVTLVTSIHAGVSLLNCSAGIKNSGN
jgi:hypothetical protein